MDFQPVYQTPGEKTLISGKPGFRKEDPASLRAVIVVVSGAEIGESAVINNPPLEIGRDESCGFVLSDPHISKNHARITRNGKGDYVLEDLSSRNGSFVNGKRCRGTLVLKNGDQFVCGKTAMRFLLEERMKI